jgi:hypothetical protein
VRTEGWRYIRYADGGEELYDEAADPLEHTNLAARPEHAARKAELAKLLPTKNHPDIGNPDGTTTPAQGERRRARGRRWSEGTPVPSAPGIGPPKRPPRRGRVRTP